MKRVKYFSDGLPEGSSGGVGAKDAYADEIFEVGTCLAIESHTLLLAFIDDLPPVWSILCPDAKDDNEKEVKVGGCIQVSDDEDTGTFRDGDCWLMIDIQDMGWEIIGGSDLIVGFEIAAGFPEHDMPKVIPTKVQAAVLSGGRD